MIEIVIGLWLISFILSMLLIAWNYKATLQQVSSQKLKALNHNLKKIGYYWSVSNENFDKYEEGIIEKDRSLALRSNLFLGLLGLASVLGFILLLAIILSLRFLIKNRRTTTVFHSALTEDENLSAEEVKKLFQQMSEVY